MFNKQRMFKGSVKVGASKINKNTYSSKVLEGTALDNSRYYSEKTLLDLGYKMTSYNRYFAEWETSPDCLDYNVYRMSKHECLHSCKFYYKVEKKYTRS